MTENHILFSLFLIFSGAAIIATLSLYTRQSLLVAYIILGAIFGPGGLKLIDDPALLNDIGDIGIIFLLFLLGLNLEPHNLIKTLKQTTVVTIVSSAVFAMFGYGVSLLWGFNSLEATIISVCMMFSSTIIGLKLLPTTVLHHQRMGELVISILLLQDIIAIFVLFLLHGTHSSQHVDIFKLVKTVLALPLLVVFAYLVEKYFLIKFIKKFNRIHEYLFLIAIGWCLALAQIAESMHLSYEIGAFIAGISLAQNPIARFIAESLKPVRDFFLILFFFSLGAKIELSILNQVLLPALGLAVLMLVLKPLVFQRLVNPFVTSSANAWEVGVRIGQISEFSMLVGYTAEKAKLISQSAYSLIQLTTIITFIISSYWVVNKFPSPIAFSEKLRRD